MTVAALMLVACQSHHRASSAVPTASQAAALCYAQLSGQPGQLSIELLRLERDGQRVSGRYLWLPWQKDRRLGELEGQLEAAGVARVVYRFSQEGQLPDARLTILFDDRQATIRWDPTDPPGQPMPLVQLPSRPCGALKPVPSR